MRRGPLVAALLAFVTLSVLGGLILGGKLEADASTLSRGASGWLAARRYLEERGCRVGLLDRPFEARSAAVVVVTFPWQSFAWNADASIDGFETHLRNGGTLVLGVSSDRWAAGQAPLLRALDLHWVELRGDPPLLPWRWREFASAEWRLASEDEPGADAVRIDAPRGLPRMPASGRALWRGEGGVPAVFSFERQKGRVLVLPSSALANARLAEGGNADLLEQLHVALGDEWAFDEFHHGLIAEAAARDAGSARFLDLFLAHLALLYILALLALARRFGPPWAEPAVISGSTASFLVSLGALHHHLGHDWAASRLLLERAQELDPRLSLAGMADAREGQSLLALGQRVAKAQARKGGER